MNGMSLLELPRTMGKANSNMKWFIDNQQPLIDKFPNEYVAIDNEQLIDQDKKFESLLERLKNNGQYTDTVLIQQVHDKNAKLMF